MLKTERLAKNHLRILFWNCGSLSVRQRTAEMLASQNDIVCLQETQHAVIRPIDFHSPITSKKGHGQLILVRKGIKHKELDVTRWASDNLHLVAVEISEQPVRNIVNVYACNRSMKEQDWLILDDLQNTLPGETVLCGDFNARGELWGNSVTNPQGEALEDALDKCYLTCINDGSITRMATRPGDSDSVIDLTLTTLQIASSCNFRVLGPQGNDHLQCSVLIKRSKNPKRTKRSKAFKYSKEGDDPITKLRVKKSPAIITQKGRHREQPPWFTNEVKELWTLKRTACRRSQRNKHNAQLKDEAKAASNAFEKAAGNEKERLYEEFSRTVTEDRTLHKFWQLHKAMNGNKSKAEIPDFRTEDDVWMRTPEEKGAAFLDRFLRQTDQNNEDVRSSLFWETRNLLRRRANNTRL